MTERADLSTADLAGKSPSRSAAPIAEQDDGVHQNVAREAVAQERERAQTGHLDAVSPDDALDADGQPGTSDVPGNGVARAQPRPVGEGTLPEVGAADSGVSVAGTRTGPLLPSSDMEGFRARWTDVQTGFVDAPRHAVERADALVAELMQHLAATFADERGRLEGQWARGDDVATDDLRTAFQRYRSFFERLLST